MSHLGVVLYEYLDEEYPKKVQESYIDFVGHIADCGAEFVSAREWMYICFKLLDMLKAYKKDICCATVNIFGYIAKAIGPQDVLATLLNNLKVQNIKIEFSLSFLFEYTGEMGKDYIYAITLLLEGTLIDRDLVHRQTVCTIVKDSEMADTNEMGW
ncbi:20438_t:CDS:2, partial [Dentiscutata erythropus]